MKAAAKTSAAVRAAYWAGTSHPVKAHCGGPGQVRSGSGPRPEALRGHPDPPHARSRTCASVQDSAYSPAPAATPAALPVAPIARPRGGFRPRGGVAGAPGGRRSPRGPATPRPPAPRRRFWSWCSSSWCSGVCCPEGEQRGASAARLGGRGPEFTASGVPREAFQPGDPDFSRSLSKDGVGGQAQVLRVRDCCWFGLRQGEGPSKAGPSSPGGPRSRYDRCCAGPGTPSRWPSGGWLGGVGRSIDDVRGPLRDSGVGKE